MYFGKDHRSFSCSPIYLNNVPLEFVEDWKYLGVVLKASDCFSCSATKPRCSFYHSSNAILSALKGPSEAVQMKLLYSICVPVATYGCDVVEYHNRELESLHVAVNDAIRKIFSYNRWESVKTLRESFGYRLVTEIFALRKASFERNMRHIGNSFLSSLCCV